MSHNSYSPIGDCPWRWEKQSHVLPHVLFLMAKELPRSHVELHVVRVLGAAGEIKHPALTPNLSHLPAPEGCAGVLQLYQAWWAGYP